MEEGAGQGERRAIVAILQIIATRLVANQKPTLFAQVYITVWKIQ